jgi:hypothetical protein
VAKRKLENSFFSSLFKGSKRMSLKKGFFPISECDSPLLLLLLLLELL